MSYMSLTAQVSPASGPVAAPGIGASMSCGMKAERAWEDCGMEARNSVLLLGQIPVENLRAVPGDDAVVPENGFERALDMGDAVRHAGQVGMHGDRHDLRPLGGFRVEASELIERPAIHHVGGMMLQRHHDDVVD